MAKKYSYEGLHIYFHGYAHEELAMMILGYEDYVSDPSASTTGFGHRYEDREAKAKEMNFKIAAEYVKNDIERAYKEADRTIHGFSKLTPYQQDAIVDFIYNCGPSSQRGFERRFNAGEKTQYNFTTTEKGTFRLNLARRRDKWSLFSTGTYTYWTKYTTDSWSGCPNKNK